MVVSPVFGVACEAMSEHDDDPGLRGRITRSGEDAIGRLASELLENPLVTGAIGRIFEAREKASQAQAVAFGALNLPSAADLERLTRRVRSVSQRLEAIEDGVDKLDRRLGSISAPASEDSVRDAEASLAKRIGAVEEALSGLTREIHALRESLPDAPRAIPTSQERLEVDAAQESKPKTRRRKPAASS
jgi:chromosome segregation ATPase